MADERTLADLADQAIVTRLRAAGCVFAEDEARLLATEARTPAELADMVARRATGVPLEQVLGWVDFCGRRIAVDPGVFVPRRRTQFLVQLTIDLARQAPGAGEQPDASPAIVIDLCCGSGAVAAALAAALGGVELYAVDIDPAAVRCARRNLSDTAQVYEGDLCRPLPAALRGRVDVLVANAPYVPTEEIALMPPEARSHEPRIALDGGADGLDIQRRVIAAAESWLAPAAHLLIETSELQAPGTAEAFTRHGFDARVVRSEELAATVVLGTRPPRAMQEIG